MAKNHKFTSGLAFRMICGILILLCTFNLTISVIGYIGFTDTLTSEYNDAAFRTAETAATLVDGDKIDHYLEKGMRDPDYRSRWQRMDVLCQKQQATLIYVIAVDTSDYGRFLSVFNTVNDASGYSPWEVGYLRDTTNEEYRQIYQNIYENGLEQGTVVRTSGLNGREPHITSLIPIKNSQEEVTAILCVERPMSGLKSGRETYLNSVAYATISMAILSALLVAFYLKHEFVLPVRKIIKEAKRFAKENRGYSGTSLMKLSKIREISELGSSVAKMEKDILKYMENLTQATAERERLATELSLAASIQANMLPKVFPPFPEHPELDIYASMTPAKEVGGDFYDYFFIDEEQLCLIIADVSGKGVPAALFMMRSMILLNSRAQQQGGSLEQLLEDTNVLLNKNNEDDMFVTVWFGILNIKTGQVRAVNAGHEWPIIRKPNGEFEILRDQHGFVLGPLPEVKCFEYSFTLEKGSSLFLYTDGLPEASDRQEEMFTIQRILDALNRQPDVSSEELLHNVSAAVKDFVGTAEPFDDMTMLSIRYY
ncbi:MAG: PP2C family protein-serine/threonine phosphatase [Bacillota bacterium]|nr:PP2C family protein-serine/threonine phosphatase [Bacillota bacterium]